MKQRNGISQHESCNSSTNEWYTPREILLPLGEFDLDPCSPVVRPWPTAKVHFTKEDNGLALDWFGRVWLNPPYDYMGIFMKKMGMHMNGIALTFARTDTEAFQKYIFPAADSMLFIDGRINFLNAAGMRARMNAGAPSVLIAYGDENVDCLASCKIKGKHVFVNATPILVVAASPKWKNVVEIALIRLNGKGNLEKIYEMVERIAPDKVQKNPFFKEKVRQQLQQHFVRIGKGHYSQN
jgi:hypothetical protein